MKNVKLIATDLDATFLKDDKTISQFTIDTVSKVMDLGILFVPCSARNYKCLPEWFLNNDRIKYLVSSNGSNIIDNASKKPIHQACIPGSLALKILEETKEINSYWTIDIDGFLYASNDIIKDHEALSIDLQDPNNIFVRTRTFIDDFHDVLQEDSLVNKLHFVSLKNKESLYDTLSKFDEIDITSSHVRNFEIISKSAGKEKALAKIMELENISATECMAFGDNDNDISMIESVKYGVAVANAKDNLKKVAKYTTSSNNEDGVAHFLNENIVKIKNI